MQSKLINNDQGRTFAVVLQRDDEVIESILQFAQEYNLSAARLSAIGALSQATLGFFDPGLLDYIRIRVDEQVEVLSLTGNIAVKEGTPVVHAHVVLGKKTGEAIGGHMLEGFTNPTLEVMLVESPEHLRREMDESTGLPMLNVKRA